MGNRSKRTEYLTHVRAQRSASTVIPPFRCVFTKPKTKFQLAAVSIDIRVRECAEPDSTDC